MLPNFLMLFNSFLLALALATNPASALVNIPITKRIATANAGDIVKRDQARARYFVTGGSPEQIVNGAVDYTAQVGVGTPPTNYTLLIDTGSSTTWVGSNKTYVQTSTSVKTNQNMNITYAVGNVTGVEYIDTVTIGSLVISKQWIGVANKNNGFSTVDGILGIGPVDLTINTLRPDKNITIPTVTDNAYSQGLIPANEIGISFEPTDSLSVSNGEMVWGGVDKTKFTGQLHYAPITKTKPAGHFWGVNQTVTYGSTTILDNSAGIIDTGTSLVLLATDALHRYQNATGATVDKTTKFLTISPSDYAALKPLSFNINGKIFDLTPNAQTWPRPLNTAIGGKAAAIYLIIGDLGQPSGKGFDFTNGYAFLERYYTVYDTANKRVGFAPTPFTYATTN